MINALRYLFATPGSSIAVKAAINSHYNGAYIYMRVSSHDISYNSRIIWIARARPDIFLPWKTGSNKIPASDKTLFVRETCSARARYVLIAPRVPRRGGLRSRLMHEHAFVRGSYILIIHLRNQDVAFVKINLGRFSCKYNWFSLGT